MCFEPVRNLGFLSDWEIEHHVCGISCAALWGDVYLHFGDDPNADRCRGCGTKVPWLIRKLHYEDNPKCKRIEDHHQENARVESVIQTAKRETTTEEYKMVVTLMVALVVLPL